MRPGNSSQARAGRSVSAAGSKVALHRREDPALGEKDVCLDLGLIAGLARASRDDGGAVVRGKIGKGAVDLGLGCCEQDGLDRS